MRLVFVLFDSLNRLALQPYGGQIETPNFQRLAERSVTFERHYSGSLPCMPARRDLHTGRLNFMHRSWGPLEPFDNSFADILKQRGVYSHLVTDHFHYFEDGGAGYHTRYNSWEFIRGQEFDPWKADVAPPLADFAQRFAAQHYDPAHMPRRLQHLVNREAMQAEGDQPTPRCFASAKQFLDTNRDHDDWLLQLELFDPHEPFFAPDRFRRDGDSDYDGAVLNWPPYQRRTETPPEVAEIRANYAALVRMCDDYLGRLLDYFDEFDLWKDTALVLSTDHGFLLSEHEWWGKCCMPYYEEITHIPLFIHHPDFADQAGQRCNALSQTPDIMPTILDMFDCPIPKEVRSRSLLPLLCQPDADGGERCVAFAVFAGPIGVTDGRYVMFHYPPDVSAPGLHEYTLNPRHMRTPFTAAEMATAQMAPPFGFTKGMPVMRIDALADAMRTPNHEGRSFQDKGFALYDLARDPGQLDPIRDAQVEARLYAALTGILDDLETPPEAWSWYGLEPPTRTSAKA